VSTSFEELQDFWAASSINSVQKKKPILQNKTLLALHGRQNTVDTAVPFDVIYNCKMFILLVPEMFGNIQTSWGQCY
jgi:hypothetical protein